MKKIILIFATILLSQGVIFAQKVKPVAEKDVMINYVKNFQDHVKECSNVQWWQVDSLVYKVSFLDADGSKQEIVYSNRGQEKYYYVDNQYCPQFVKDTMASLVPGYKLRELCVRKKQGKQNYQARVAKMAGFLWWKKEKDSKTLNFEIDGKFINVE